MAKTRDDDTPRKSPKAASTLVWGLLLLVMVGLGGFGVTNFGGGVSNIGTVGERAMSTSDYARALRAQINAVGQQLGMQLNMEQARAFGIDQQALQGLIARTALDGEAARLGVSVGDARVADQIAGMPAFQGAAGNFDKETYRFVLQQNGMTEAEFEKRLRDDSARSILQGAVTGALTVPPVMLDKIYAYAGEKRDFSALVLTEADLPNPLAAPTADQLAQLYKDSPDLFKTPELRRITYAALLPDDLAASQPADPAAVQALYDARKDQYQVPEKRLVERLVFPSDAEAQAARARLDAGESFDTLIKERNLTPEAIDLGDVTRQDLGAAGDAVFALTAPGVVGPITSDLGPALFRMNAILPAQNTTLDEARPELEKEVKLEAAKKFIADRTEAVDELFASGGTLEDGAKEQGMVLKTIDFDANAPDQTGIAAYGEFRTAAGAAAVGDYPTAIATPDGGLFALRLDQVIPPAVIPFDQAQDKLAKAWHDQALDAALRARAAEIKTAVDGGARLESFGITSATRGLARGARVTNLTGAPNDLGTTIFTLKPNETTVATAPGFVAVVQLNAITPAPTTGPEADAGRDDIAQNLRQSLTGDSFDLYTNALTQAAGINLNQSAIAAVQAQTN